MSARGNTIAQGFSNKMMLQMYDKNLTEFIVNRDYEGEINGVGSKLNILDIDKISEKDYAGVPLTADDLTENNGALVIDKKKSFYWKEKVLDNWLSYIKNPHNTVLDQVAKERSKNMDRHVLQNFIGDIGAGNLVGTPYTTGTVAIAATTGVVTGSGTTFTAAMVGRSFKASGQTTWYRIKTYSSATSITIEDDKDDIDSAYTGGVINAGATYEVQAATAVSITKSNLLDKLALVKLSLDSAEANGYPSVPDEDRFLIVPPNFDQVVIGATGIALHVDPVYNELVKKGFIGELLGFKVFRSNRLLGNNTDGFSCIAGHKSWLTFAEKVLNARMEEDIPGDFGTAFKDLFVYGGKVKDIRRHFAALLYATFNP